MKIRNFITFTSAKILLIAGFSSSFPSLQTLPITFKLDNRMDEGLCSIVSFPGRGWLESRPRHQHFYISHVNNMPWMSNVLLIDHRFHCKVPCTEMNGRQREKYTRLLFFFLSLSYPYMTNHHSLHHSYLIHQVPLPPHCSSTKLLKSLRTQWDTPQWG